MPFSTRLTIAFGDTDPAGLVYFPNILHYCHVAMERFFGEWCGIPYSELVQKQRLGFPTVKVESEFLMPLRYGEELDIQIIVSELGRSSATFIYSISRAGDMTPCARATLVQVAMDLDSQRAVPIPEYLRDAFLRSAK